MIERVKLFKYLAFLILASLSILTGCEKDDKSSKPAPTPIPVVILSTKDPVIFREFLDEGNFIYLTGGTPSQVETPVCCVYWPSFNCLSYMFIKDVGKYSITVENTTTGIKTEEKRSYSPGYQLLFLTGEKGDLSVTFTLKNSERYICHFKYEPVS